MKKQIVNCGASSDSDEVGRVNLELISIINFQVAGAKLLDSHYHVNYRRVVKSHRALTDMNINENGS